MKRNDEMVYDLEPEYQVAFNVEDAAAIRSRFLILGTISMLLGIAAIVLPLKTEYPVEIVLGSVLFITGSADAFHSVLLRSKTGFLLSWMSASLFAFVGLILLFSHLIDFTSLTLMLGLTFLIGGALRMGKGLDIRPVPNWRWVFLSGLLGVVFCFFILFQWRTISLSTICIFTGISLIVDGWSRMILFWLCGKRPSPDGPA